MTYPQLDPEALFRLVAVPGVGPGKLRSLIGHFHSAEAVLRASDKLLTAVPGVDVNTARKIRSFDGAEFAHEQMQRLRKSGARLLTIWDGDYPGALKQIYDPPVLLYVKGELADADRLAVGIVGCRQPSAYGKVVSEKIAMELATIGVTIVSGLAYGVDTFAHQSTLRCGGRTLAVLGSGVDVIYPPENQKLARKISGAGALLSEFPMGAAPDKGNFPRRNRIISGLSLGIVVVEAGTRSGALITAALALDQNREVFAVPGNINSPKSAGPNALIQDGASLVTCTDDILDALSDALSPLMRDNTPEQPEIELDAEQARLLTILSNEPQHIDHIAHMAGQATGSVLARLLGLELMNLVRQLPGKMFVRTTTRPIRVTAGESARGSGHEP